MGLSRDGIRARWTGSAALVLTLTAWAGCSSSEPEAPGPVPGGGPGQQGTGAAAIPGQSGGGILGVPGGQTAITGGIPVPGGGAPSGGAVDTAGGGAGPGSGGSPPAGTGGGSGPPSTCDASAPPAIGRLGLEQVVGGAGLTSLVYAAQPPGSEDWYLVELGGRIHVWSGGSMRPTPFLDVRDEVPLSGTYDERGLLSLAFAPDYETSGRAYVAMVPTAGALANHDLVLEYTRSAGDPFVADPASRRAILDLLPGGSDLSGFLNWYHNGSTVKFGPDGMLYMGLGDGGGQCNSARPGAPQDINSPYGKILRLDPTAPEPHAAAGNPFAEDGDPRVLHYGVRNPFRFSFDALTGDLYFGDVGQWEFEEISFAPAGAMGLNFGWPDFEAESSAGSSSVCTSNTTLRPGSTHTLPIHVIPHGASGGAQALVMSVVGGVVYRGTAIPELYGAYLFGEYYPNRPMGALYQCGEQTSEVSAIRKVCDANFPNDACFLSQGGAPPLAELGAIVEGNDGELYFPANNNTLLKVVPAP